MTDVVLVQVKTNAWPRTLERMALAEFKTGRYARKVIHRWRDYQRVPDVMEL